MDPANLSAAQFTTYPSQARALAVEHLDVLRQLPLAFLPSLLREVIEYDYKFPAEREALDRQFSFLQALGADRLRECFLGFSAIQLTAELRSFDWYARPADFTEQLAAYLWSTHQMTRFRDAAIVYGNRVKQATAAAPLPMPRLSIAVIGQGASPHQPGLFSKLREHGTLFTEVDPAGGLAAVMRCVEARAELHPAPYAHWYVDGGLPLPHAAAVTGVSYGGLAGTRAALFTTIGKLVSRPGMGPEELRDRMARLQPSELAMTGDSLVDRFNVRVLTEGSGTQIYSTTYAQWAAREALRRAEPLTLLTRFAPRQRQRPMNELLAGDEATPQLDPEGSLVDADMAAYLQWINGQRLSGAKDSSFLVWFEAGRQALAVSPLLPRGTQSSSPIGVAALLAAMTG